MAKETEINVYEIATTVVNSIPGMASSIAVIGAFNSEITDITNVSGARIAHSLLEHLLHSVHLKEQIQ